LIKERVVKFSPLTIKTNKQLRLIIRGSLRNILDQPNHRS